MGFILQQCHPLPRGRLLNWKLMLIQLAVKDSVGVTFTVCTNLSNALGWGMFLLSYLANKNLWLAMWERKQGLEKSPRNNLL